MIKAWEFDFNGVPGKGLPDYTDQDLVQRAFSRNLELLASLEGRGFEGVFYSEHHFLNSLSPCPNLLIAALASRTKRLKIGVMGNVLAFHQPWRLAEELAMLDYITEGRLEIGVASGVPPEFLFVNIPQADIRPMYSEVLDFLTASEEGRFVSFSGKYFNFEDVPIMPRPRKDARRRHWVTIYSEASCRDAARRDYKVCTGYQSVESAAKAFDGYRDEAAKLGRKVGPDDVALRRQVLLAETQAEAEALHLELQEASRLRMEDTFSAVSARLAKAGVGPSAAVKQSGVMDADAAPRAEKPVSAAPTLIISPDEYITGSPANVAEQIIDQCSRVGAGNILGYHVQSLSEAQIAKNYDLWEKVIPILKKAEVLESVTV